MTFDRETQAADIDVQVVTSRHQMESVIPEWKTFLEQSAKMRRLRQDPVSLVSRLARKPNEEPVIVLVRKSGAIQCIAVCVVYRKRLDLQFSVFKIPTARVRVLKVVDSDFIFSRSADDRDFVRSVFAELWKRDDLFDLIYLEDLRTKGPLCAYFEDHAGKSAEGFRLVTTSVTVQKIHKHVLMDSYEAWLKTINRKSRKGIRRKNKKLSDRFADDIHLVKATSEADIPEFQKHLNELYPKTWQAKVLGPQRRQTDRDTEIFVQAANNGWFRAYLLRLGDRIVAFDIGYQYSGVYLASEGGYDPEFSTWGVGSILQQMILQDLYVSDSPREYNLGFGDNEYKWAISTDAQVACQAYITRPGTPARLIGAQKILNRLESATRKFLIRTGLVGIVRKVVKRK